MECPKCQARMEVVRFEGTDVDRCIRCGGVWFDLLEHEELKRRPGSEAIDTGPAWQAPMHDVQGRVFCPVDGALMVRMVDAAQPHIWLESCPMCHGTFFDAGEFKDFKERTIGDLLRRRRRHRPPQDRAIGRGRPKLCSRQHSGRMLRNEGLCGPAKRATFMRRFTGGSRLSPLSLD